MTIGIIVAMGKELNLLLQIVENPVLCESDGFKFYTGMIGDAKIVAMQCGIGKVNAAIGATALIEKFSPDCILNSGVAGGTGQGAKILDVVLAKEIAYHDVWCGPGTEWGQAAGCPPAFPCPADADALAAHLDAKAGMIASGDIFVSREEDVRRILSLYPSAIAVDMESGAIAQACFLKSVPMYCLRVVSDTPGQADNISQYANFWEDAPAHTFNAVKKLIEFLNHEKDCKLHS